MKKKTNKQNKKKKEKRKTPAKKYEHFLQQIVI